MVTILQVAGLVEAPKRDVGKAIPRACPRKSRNGFARQPPAARHFPPVIHSSTLTSIFFTILVLETVLIVATNFFRRNIKAYNY